MVDRIKQLLEWQQLTPTQFADRIGIGRPVVSHILSERNKPSLDVVQRIIAAFPALSLPWLLSGTGDMLATASSALPTQAATPIALVERLIPQVSTPQSVAAAAPAPADSAAKATAPGAAAASIPAFRAATNTNASRPAMTATVQAVPPRFRPNQGGKSAQLVANETNNSPEAGPTGDRPLDVVSALADSLAGSSASATGATTEEPLPARQERAGSLDAVAAPPITGLPAGTQGTASKAGSSADGAGLAEALSVGFAEPGKAIRRIVIFYRDGSFADYQPEG